MKRAKKLKPQPLPPPEQAGLFTGQRETLGLPIFAGSPARVMEDAFKPRATKDPNAQQARLF